MIKHNKKKSLRLLETLINKGYEIYGVDRFDIDENGEEHINNEESCIVRNHEDDNKYFRSIENYKFIKAYIDNSPKDSNFYIFCDLPNYEIKYRIRGFIKHYNRSNSLKMLSYLKQKRYKILGIDAFELTETYTRPESTYSIDFTADPYVYMNLSDDEIYNKSTELIMTSPEHLYFEFVYENHDEIV